MTTNRRRRCHRRRIQPIERVIQSTDQNNLFSETHQLPNNPITIYAFIYMVTYKLGDIDLACISMYFHLFHFCQTSHLPQFPKL